MISTLLEVAGFVCLVVSAWCWDPLVGLLAAGLVLLLIGYALDGVAIKLPRFFRRIRRAP